MLDIIELILRTIGEGFLGLVLIIALSIWWFAHWLGDGSSR